MQEGDVQGVQNACAQHSQTVSIQACASSSMYLFVCFTEPLVYKRGLMTREHHFSAQIVDAKAVPARPWLAQASLRAATPASIKICPLLRNLDQQYNICGLALDSFQKKYELANQPLPGSSQTYLEGPCLPAAPGWRRHLLKCDSSQRPRPPFQRPPPSRRRQ